MSDKTHVHGGRESSGGIVLTKRRTNTGEGQRRSWRENSQNNLLSSRNQFIIYCESADERTQGVLLLDRCARQQAGTTARR